MRISLRLFEQTKRRCNALRRAICLKRCTVGAPPKLLECHRNFCQFFANIVSKRKMRDDTSVRKGKNIKEEKKGDKCDKGRGNVLNG